MVELIPETKPKAKEPRQFFWHGTKGQNLESVLKEGLKIAIAPKLGASQQFAQYYFDGLGVVCLTNHEGNGCFYATASYPIDAVMTDEFQPVVLQINPEKLNESFLTKRESAGDSRYNAYRGANEFDYHSDIPPEAIIGILKWNKEKRKYEYFQVDVNGKI